MGECRGRHPWRRRMVTFTWKEALGVLFFNEFHVLYRWSLRGREDEFTSFFRDLLRYMLTTSTVPACRSLMARISSPLWNRHTDWGWPVQLHTLTHTHTHQIHLCASLYIVLICFYGWIMLNDLNILYKYTSLKILGNAFLRKGLDVS